jgi:chorismate-pyruvate lyase
MIPTDSHTLLDPSTQAQAWLGTSRSLTLALKQLAAPDALQHELTALGWVIAAEKERAIWPQLRSGERLWQREIAFWVQDQLWLQARVLIPQASLLGPAGVALQYCGARSLGAVLFQDPNLRRERLDHASEQRPDGLWLTRHSLHYFYDKPVLIAESFSPLVWQQELP